MPSSSAHKSAFDILNLDELHGIVEFASPDDIASINLTCIAFRSVARPFLYRSMVLRARHLDSDEEEYQQMLEYYTRHIEIDRKTDLDPELIADFLFRLQKLETLKWNVPKQPIPFILLQALQIRWPDASLEVIHRLPSNIAPQSQLTRLIGYPALKSIKVDAHLTWGETDYPPMVELKDVLVTCTGLRRLELTFPSCSWSGASDDARRLPFGDGESLPPLEELVLDRYYFHTKKEPISAWDWSQLRRLTLRDVNLCQFFKYVKGKISCLDYLEIEYFHGPRDGKAINSFLKSITGLKELVLASDAAYLDLWALAPHGRTLKSLTLRGWFDNRKAPEPKNSSAESMSRFMQALKLVDTKKSPEPKYGLEEYMPLLNMLCPLIQDLEMDIIHTTHFESKPRTIPCSESLVKMQVKKSKDLILKPLTKFRNLSNLTFCFEKVFPKGGSHAKRWDTWGAEDTARLLFDEIAKPKKGRPLERLNLVFHQYRFGGLGDFPIKCVKLLSCTPDKFSQDETEGGTPQRAASTYDQFLNRWGGGGE